MNTMYKYTYIKFYKLKYTFGFLHNKQRWLVGYL